jgi:hypothetical protein
MRFSRGFDFVEGNKMPLDRDGHGTHVASTIAERTGNRFGLTGLAYKAKIIPVRVLDELGFGPYSGRIQYMQAPWDLLDYPGGDWVSNPHGYPDPCGRELPLDLNGQPEEGVPSAWTHVVTVEPARHEEHEEGVEPEGVDALGILRIGFISLVVLVVIVVVSIVLVDRQMVRTEQSMANRAQYPLKQKVRQQAEEKLTGYGAVSDAENTYRIPIDRAMDLVVEERYGENDEGGESDAP